MFWIRSSLAMTFSLFLFSCASKNKFDAPLYKITKAGETKGYILGIVHSEGSVEGLPTQNQEIIKKSEHFFVPHFFSGDDFSGGMKDASTFFRPPGFPPIKKILGPQKYQRLAAAYKKLKQEDQAKLIFPGISLNQLSPKGALALGLSATPDSQQSWKTNATAFKYLFPSAEQRSELAVKLIETDIQKMATQMGANVYELDSGQLCERELFYLVQLEYLELLLDLLGDDKYELDLTEHLVQGRKYLPDFIEQVDAKLLNQKVSQKNLEADSKDSEEILRCILDERNKLWASKLDEHFTYPGEYHVMTVVGIAHLQDRSRKIKSLIHYLKVKGYQVGLVKEGEE